MRLKLSLCVLACPALVAPSNFPPPPSVQTCVGRMGSEFWAAKGMVSERFSELLAKSRRRWL